jgi:integrase
MKHDPPPATTAVATLQTVLDRLAGDSALSDRHRRELRAPVIRFAKLLGEPPSAIPLDLAAIRQALDGMVSARAKVSAKRWSNLRSGLAGAIRASGLRPMIKTAGLDLDPNWTGLLASADLRERNGLSRLGRWASERGIAPQVVNDSTMRRFIAELDEATLIRNLGGLDRTVRQTWNALAGRHWAEGLQPVAVPTNRPAPTKELWRRLPASFREDVEGYLAWAAVPDPLADGARAKALAPLSLRLQRTHVRSAVTAAVAAGIRVDEITSLARLLEPETFRTVLRHLWQGDGGKLTAYTHGVAVTLIAIASEWVEVSRDDLAALKALRSKLGTLPTGLTEKNRALLLKFEDPHLLQQLIGLPEKVWRRARQQLASSRLAFIDLQSALAIDLLLHTGLRMENLSALNFEGHLHWPRGRGKPALLVFGGDETKNEAPYEAEIPAYLADRLWIYRHEIAPQVTATRPGAVFVTWSGTPRCQGTLSLAIVKTLRKHLGLKMSAHQFRHLLAQINLDANPGAHELVRQLLGHKNLKTTINFYAGINTRRAGRAHADLIMKIRESNSGRGRRRRKPRPRED